MEIVGRADDYRVEVFLLFQQLAEVNESGASFGLPRALLRPVIAVHNFLRGFASGDAAGHAQGVAQLKRFVGTEPLPSGIDAEQLTN